LFAGQGWRQVWSPLTAGLGVPFGCPSSLTTALSTARDQIIQAAGITAGTTIDPVGRIGAAILADPMPSHRIRTRNRVVKRAISKYRAKGRDIDHRTYPATLHTNILTPAPDG
jgi:hypothetical protein